MLVFIHEHHELGYQNIECNSIETKFSVRNKILCVIKRWESGSKYNVTDSLLMARTLFAWYSHNPWIFFSFFSPPPQGGRVGGWESRGLRQLINGFFCGLRQLKKNILACWNFTLNRITHVIIAIMSLFYRFCFYL